MGKINVNDVDFSMNDWKNLISSTGNYKTKETSSGLFIYPCPNCGAGKYTPHFLISKKTLGMTSYNCQLDKGTRPVNWFMMEYNLDFIEARKEFLKFKGIYTEENEINKFKYESNKNKKEIEDNYKEELIYVVFNDLCNRYHSLRKILNKNHKYFKRKKPTLKEIENQAKWIDTYNIVSSKIDSIILSKDLNQKYKICKRILGEL